MTEIVLTLGGLNKGRIDRLDTALQGYTLKSNRRRVIINYPQSDSKESILTGVAQLDAAVRLWLPTPDQITLFGHSQGAEVISEWLERYAKRADAPLRGELKILLIGNPCRRVGGVVTAGTWVTKQGYLGKRKPTPETQYDTLDVSTAGDVWANADGWPTMKRPKSSLWDILLGRDPHTNGYDKVDINKCRLRERSGNTQYLVAP